VIRSFRQFNRSPDSFVVQPMKDQNTYAMGGIAGHAGLFATLNDVITLSTTLLGATSNSFLNRTTLHLFTVNNTIMIDLKIVGLSVARC
jgi:hypothetical protein